MSDSKKKVYNFISEQLTSGLIGKKSKITEQYLVDHTGLSRTPVREALFQLTADGMLEKEPRKGFKFKQFTKKDFEDLYEYIGVLDGKIAEFTINELAESDYLMLNFLIESMDSAIKNSLYTEYNELQEKFHNVYIDKSKNNLLKKELLIKKQLLVGKDYSNIDSQIIKSVLIETNNEHKEILKLMKNKESTKLRNYLEIVHWKKDNVKFDIW